MVNDGTSPIVPIEQIDSEEPVVARGRLRRRSFLGVAASGAAFVAAGRGFAQDATPGATPAPPDSSSGNDSAESTGAQFPTVVPVGPAVPPEFDTPTNWPAEGYDLQSTRNVQSSSISANNIDQLGEAWRFSVPTSAAYGALVANPTIVDGTIFIQDALSNVYALDLETGEQLWTNTYNKHVPSGGPNGTANAYGNVYYTVGGPADVVAASAADGTELWKTNILGYRNEGITVAPVVYDNTLYVSTIPGSPEAFYNGGQRGFIFALDASTGGIIWYFDTVVDNLWGNARINSGGGLWHPPSFDEAGNIFVGIANAAPYPGTEEFPSGSSRPGDNDYANALMRINPATAGIDWYINVKPFDIFDLDNHLSPIVATVSVNGTDTPMVYSSGKHGLVIAANSETGEEVWRTPVGRHQNDDLQELPTDGSTVEVFPGTLGGVETPFAYADGVIYAPVYNMASVYSQSELDATSIDIANTTGQLVALDGATGDILWDVALPTGQLAGATITNDVIFSAGLDGVLHGFAIADGSEVFRFQAAAGINAPLAASGDYLLVPAGGPLLASTDTVSPAPTPTQELIALRIGGTVQATPRPGAATPETEGTPAATTGDAAAGGTTFDVSMVDLAFDPKEFTIPADTDVTITVTNNGALQHNMDVKDTGFETEVAGAGDVQALTVNLPAGSYPFQCDVPGHAEAGMVGVLTVQ